jgi:hypothetical protein
MKRAGLKRSPAPKRTYDGSAKRHFFWLAGYQVAGWSQIRIAEAARVDRAAVQRAIHHGLAEQTGLTLRPPKDHDLSWTIERIRAALSYVLI